MSASAYPDLEAIHRELGVPPDYATIRRLPWQAEATEERVLIAVRAGRAITLTVPAAAAWQEMKEAAAKRHVILIPLSGFRSVERQIELFRAKKSAGQSVAEILRVNAAPGFSEHHTGRAVDIGTNDSPPFEESFAATTAFRWLEAHAGSFGFSLSYPANNPHGIVFEPWHWLWQPGVGR
jgi:D-alanyl-D-alanine carboxypeptidase